MQQGIVEPVAAPGPQERELIRGFAASGVPAVLAVNKIDTVEPQTLLAVIAAYAEAHDFAAVVPISAQNGDGVEELLAELEKFAVASEPLFDEGVTTDQPEKQVCAELIREKLLRELDREDHRPGGHDLLREGQPQGDHHRKARRDAQEDRRRGAGGYRAVHGHKGLPSDLGEGKGKLARLPVSAAQFRVHRHMTRAVSA